jgi:cell division protein FtsB
MIQTQSNMESEKQQREIEELKKQTQEIKDSEESKEQQINDLRKAE